MKTIWKYAINLDPVPQKVMMPDGAKVIHADVQEASHHGHMGFPSLWAVVNPKAQLRDYWFLVLGTGQDIPTPSPKTEWVLEHIGTVKVAGGTLMWHIFEMSGQTGEIKYANNYYRNVAAAATS